MKSIIELLVSNSGFIYIVATLIATGAIAWINKKLLAQTIKIISAAESRVLIHDEIIPLIEKIRKSDMDERMVEVIATLMHSVPFIKLIPKSIAVKILNNYVQKAFDLVESALDATSCKNTEEDKKIISDAIDTLKSEVEIPTSEVSDKLEKSLNDILSKALKINIADGFHEEVLLANELMEGSKYEKEYKKLSLALLRLNSGILLAKDGLAKVKKIYMLGDTINTYGEALGVTNLVKPELLKEKFSVPVEVLTLLRDLSAKKRDMMIEIEALSKNIPAEEIINHLKSVKLNSTKEIESVISELEDGTDEEK